MKALVQSKHILSQDLLYTIWRRSNSEDSFREWLKNPETNLGLITRDFFWANWVKTNKGLVPVIEREILLDWRIQIQLERNESQTLVFEETPASVWVWQNNKTVHYQLIFSDGRPELCESEVPASELPLELAAKTAAIERHLPAGIQKRLDELRSRLTQLTERRA